MAESLKDGRAKTSTIWKHFEIKDVEANCAQCNQCTTKLRRGKSSGDKKDYSNTSLWNHLKRKHPLSFKEADDERREYNENRKKQKLDKEKKERDILLTANT